MSHDIVTPAAARILGPKDGEILGAPELSDRFLINGSDTGGRVAIVEHMIGPRQLAAPLHRHTTEDEFSFVLEGQFAAVLGDEQVLAHAGDLVFKPRGQWHTFWNPGDTPTRVLEIISPAGLEEFFRMIGNLDEEGFTPEAVLSMADMHGCAVDYERTGAIVEQHGLTF